ncbi:MAG: hypothetical protein IPK67_00705 [Planctomycetes bacterium]|nr:hypothetical protein [Planctomycetota bacterium]
MSACSSQLHAKFGFWLAALLLIGSCSIGGDSEQPSTPPIAAPPQPPAMPEAPASKAEPTPEPAPVAAAPVQVKLVVDAMHAVRTTTKGADGDRDEVYFLAWTEGSMARLPSSDDYYEGIRGHHLQQDGWTNQDQKQLGTPVLWNGTLADGERRILYVIVAEQDGDPILMTKFWTDTFATKPIDPLIPARQAIANRNHQVLGSFSVIVRNVGGNLELASWTPGPYTVDYGLDPNYGPRALRFVGHRPKGCEYHFVVSVRQS